jgi:hypothetical protein
MITLNEVIVVCIAGFSAQSSCSTPVYPVYEKEEEGFLHTKFISGSVDGNKQVYEVHYDEMYSLVVAWSTMGFFSYNPLYTTGIHASSILS